MEQFAWKPPSALFLISQHSWLIITENQESSAKKSSCGLGFLRFSFGAWGRLFSVAHILMTCQKWHTWSFKKLSNINYYRIIVLYSFFCFSNPILCQDISFIVNIFCVFDFIRWKRMHFCLEQLSVTDNFKNARNQPK